MKRLEKSNILERLRQNDEKLCYDEPQFQDGDSNLPKHLNVDRFERGQNFFIQNMSNCIFAMIISLAYGLAINNLLYPLVFTRNSNTPRKASKRYVHTLTHILKWHMCRVWEICSPARQSINAVRKMHSQVAKSINEGIGDKKKFVTQYDMSLVQCGFIGLIVMAHKGLGIQCTEEELDDYVYFWRWIGFLLGISDENNICIHGYKHALRACTDIDEFVVYPALKQPPKDFSVMAKAFTDGLNLLIFIPVFSYKSLINFATELLGRNKIYDLGYIDQLRILFLKFSIFLLRYSPRFKGFMNQRCMMFSHTELDKMMVK